MFSETISKRGTVTGNSLSTVFYLSICLLWLKHAFSNSSALKWILLTCIVELTCVFFFHKKRN